MESLHLQSPGYPSDVITPTDCEWTITSSKGTRIQITVHDLQIWPFSASFSISDMTFSNDTQYIIRNPREAKLREVVSYGHAIKVTFWAEGADWSAESGSKVNARFSLKLLQVVAGKLFTSIS